MPGINAEYLASLDAQAFLSGGEVGPPPDMMTDDLPSNLDYLDDSYSASAGLRELRDDDLHDFDDSEPGSGRSTPTPASDNGKIISVIGGETIKILKPLRFVDNHFNRLTPHILGQDIESVVLPNARSTI